MKELCAASIVSTCCPGHPPLSLVVILAGTGLAVGPHQRSLSQRAGPTGSGVNVGIGRKTPLYMRSDGERAVQWNCGALLNFHPEWSSIYRPGHPGGNIDFLSSTENSHHIQLLPLFVIHIYLGSIICDLQSNRLCFKMVPQTSAITQSHWGKVDSQCCKMERGVNGYGKQSTQHKMRMSYLAFTKKTVDGRHFVRLLSD